MLVLTRKYQEKIRIGNNITITVLRTKGKAVRLGIEAPADVPVIRGELSFDHESKAATEEEEVMTVAFADVEKPLRRVGSVGIATATRWETTRDLETKVELSRVPRDKVASVLPKLVSGNAPLRAMMDKGITR
jgi:carbon storage regulator